jgi:hypothetical protein
MLTIIATENFSIQFCDSRNMSYMLEIFLHKVVSVFQLCGNKRGKYKL